MLQINFKVLCSRLYVTDSQYPNEEELQRQKSLDNSDVLQGRGELSVDEAPTFYPTQDEFADPLKYINR